VYNSQVTARVKCTAKTGTILAKVRESQPEDSIRTDITPAGTPLLAHGRRRGEEDNMRKRTWLGAERPALGFFHSHRLHRDPGACGGSDLLCAEPLQTSEELDKERAATCDACRAGIPHILDNRRGGLRSILWIVQRGRNPLLCGMDSDTDRLLGTAFNRRPVLQDDCKGQAIISAAGSAGTQITSQCK